MKKMFIVAALGLAVMFSSCAKFPQVEVDAATASVLEAKTTGADLYVPGVFQALTDSLNSANQKVEVDKSKFFKTYKVSKASLASVVTMSADVKAKTEARKVELKAENDSLVAEVKVLVADSKVLLVKAPKGKDGKAALSAIAVDISVVETTVTEVETLIASGNLLDSNSKIKVAKDKVTTVKTELETAIAKASGKK